MALGVGTAKALPLLAFSVTLPPAAGDPVLLDLGEALDVALVVSGLGAGTPPDVAAWDLTVSYDPALLTFESASVNSGLGSPVGQPFLQSVDDSTPGEVRVQFASIEPSGFFTGQPDGFDLFSLSFTATGSGAGLLSLLDPVDVFDPDGFPLSVSTAPLGVLVSEVAEPATLGLLAAALAAAAARARPRA